MNQAISRAISQSHTHTPRAVDLFVEQLHAYGFDTVFGIPGGLLSPFFMAVEASEMKLVVSRHEQGAAFMADGFYRSCGRMAIAAATSGPGATNLMTGVACAFADGVPMLVLTGQANSANLGRGAAQEMPASGMDIVSMLAPITKYSAAVDSPEKLVFHFRHAVKRALSGHARTEKQQPCRRHLRGIASPASGRPSELFLCRTHFVLARTVAERGLFI